MSNKFKTRVRTSLAILLLLLIGLYAFNSKRTVAPNLSLPQDAMDNLRDSVAANPAHTNAGLHMGDTQGDELKDSVAANPAFGDAGPGNPPSSPSSSGPDPRGIGGDLGGGNPNPGSEFGPNGNNNTPTLSPSGPQNNNQVIPE